MQRRKTALALGNRWDDLLIYRFNNPHGYGVLRDGVYMPHWFLVVGFAVLSAVPWIEHIHWRFTLRTLLIATTLVAIVLGLIVWAVR
jgi:hypothetical protein